MPEFFNPLEHAFITSNGRVDEGVDYNCAGGYLSAIADCQVFYSDIAAPGWPGGQVQYRITQPGPLAGAWVYYAEGIHGLPSVGTNLHGGEGVCFLNPGGTIEIGWGSANPPNSWAREYSTGYDQANSTRSGISFNQLLAALHSRTGYLTGHPIGTAPPWNISGITSPIGGSLTPGQLLAAYNPSTIIRHSFYRFGEYGRNAQDHALSVRRLLGQTRYTTSKGRN